MSLATTKFKSIVEPTDQPDPNKIAADASRELRQWFGVDFTIWNAKNGKIVRAALDQPAGDEMLRASLVHAIVNQTEPELLDDADSVVVLGLPLQGYCQQPWVAVAAFVARPVSNGEDLAGPMRLLALDQPSTRQWIDKQQVWDAESLLRLGSAVLAKLTAEHKNRQLEHEIEKVSNNLASTYEEISLLYGVTQNLRLSSTDEELGQLALDWLIECLPANAVAIQFLPVAEAGDSYKAREKTAFLFSGECPIDCDRMTDLVESVSPEVDRWPWIVNELTTDSPSWRFPEVRQMILAPLYEGENVHGWLAAFNHVDDDEFDSVEANLLTSVGAILGIHSGNHDLYRQQSEFMANVVRALTSAIDAKDPYTCGHSDRVARVSVRLAKQLGCSDEDINTLYMAGLLHDIGKIGIDDNVLRKTARLSDAEYEHIKMHPELGYKILVDLKQFSDVLPVVLHHHEQWDGGGYPHGLVGEATPTLARICSVADAYDAMTSDRPYRKGMPQDKVNSIFRKGGGTQWDPQVVDAYFEVKDDIAEISRRERENLGLDVQQWL